LNVAKNSLALPTWKYKGRNEKPTQRRECSSMFFQDFKLQKKGEETELENISSTEESLLHNAKFV